MVSYSFGEEGVDRYIVVYKKEFVPSEDELNALRRGEEWNEEKARQIAEKVSILNIRPFMLFSLNMLSFFLEKTRRRRRGRIRKKETRNRKIRSRY